MEGPDPGEDPHLGRRARPRSPVPMTLAAIVALIALGGLGFWYWGTQDAGEMPAPVGAAPVGAAPVAQAPPAAPAPVSSAASEPAIQFPVAAADTASAPMLASDDIVPLVTGLVGAKAVATFLVQDDLAGRLVATVDALGREQASTLRWPVVPTPGRFAVVTRAGHTVISPDNGARYTPFVQFVEGIDSARLGALYARIYPLLQRSYVELGYPRGYFNDRVVAVIDQLLGTPESEQPIEVRLTEVKGPIPATRPWVRYEYADPALQSLAAGQKIMLRVGPVNERRLKAVLRDWRARLVALGAQSR